MAQKLILFFQELKRRKVYRAATVYAITGWIIVEVTDTIFPHLGLPDWVVTSIIVFILAGFPVALILGRRPYERNGDLCAGLGPGFIKRL